MISQQKSPKCHHEPPKNRAFMAATLDRLLPLSHHSWWCKRGTIRSNDDFLKYFVYYNVVNIYRIPYTIKYNYIYIDNVKYKVWAYVWSFWWLSPWWQKKNMYITGNSSETCKTCFVRLPFAELVHASATCTGTALPALLALVHARICTTSIMGTT